MLKQSDKAIIIDRIEGEYAVVEIDGKMQEIELAILPKGVAEGDVLKAADAGYELDNQAKKQRQAALFAKQRNLFSKR